MPPPPSPLKISVSARLDEKDRLKWTDYDMHYAYRCASSRGSHGSAIRYDRF